MFQFDIEDISARIKKEGLQEITSSFLFSRDNEANPEGLASYEIFGLPGTHERKTTFAYISLGDTFIHPHAYLTLQAIRRDFATLIMGDAEFYVANGTINKIKEGESTPPGVKSGTGPNFLKEIFDELDFSYKKLPPGARRDRLRLISQLKKSEIFIDKYEVIPPFYRDVDIASGRKHELNILYARSIRLASSIGNSMGLLGVFGGLSEAHKSQMNNILAIYDYFVSIVGGTKGFIHKEIMGKTTDYSARLVISGPSFNSKSHKDMDVTFTHSAVPLFATIKCFAPYIMSEIRNMVYEYIGGSKFVWSYDPKTKTTSRHELLDNWEEILTNDYLMSLIELFDKSKHHRLNNFEIETVDGLKVPLLYLADDDIISATEGEFLDKVSKIAMPMTLTHLFYMAAYRRVKDKPVFITRFPTEDYHNIYPTLQNIIPCTKYKEMTVGNITYPKMPMVTQDDMKDIDMLYVDSLRIFSTYLPALGGDFDGDMVSIYGIFSKDGCKEAKQYINSKTNIVNIAGDTIRKTGEVVGHTLYNLTRSLSRRK